MRNSSLTKKAPASPARLHVHLILTGTLLVLIGVFLAFTLNSKANTNASSDSGLSRRTAIATPSEEASQPSSNIPVTKPGLASNQTGTPESANDTTASAPATPTLLPSTPQAARLGVFSLSEGGPLPVPESVLHPTNIARLMLNTTLVSVYAGSMTQNPQVGILCVLRENLTNGQLTLQVYQAPHPDGPLTILAIQNTKLKLTDTKSEGYFDLSTNQFEW
jgi:hypothetical protein